MRRYDYVYIYFVLTSISIIATIVCAANDVIIFTAFLATCCQRSGYVCVIKQFSRHANRRRDIVMRSLVSLTYVMYVTYRHYRETQTLFMLTSTSSHAD